MQAMFKSHMYFAKKLRLKHRLPFFCIDFNGPKWDFITYELFNSSFVNSEYFIPNCESIHFISDKDPMANSLKNHLNYERPIIVSHT